MWRLKQIRDFPQFQSVPKVHVSVLVPQGGTIQRGNWEVWLDWESFCHLGLTLKWHFGTHTPSFSRPLSFLPLPYYFLPSPPPLFPSLFLLFLSSPPPFLLFPFIFPLPLLSLLSPSSPLPPFLNTGSCYVALVLSMHSRLDLNSWQSSCLGLLSVPGLLCLLPSCIVSQGKKSCSTPAGWDLYQTPKAPVPLGSLLGPWKPYAK